MTPTTSQDSSQQPTALASRGWSPRQVRLFLVATLLVVTGLAHWSSQTLNATPMLPIDDGKPSRASATTGSVTLEANLDRTAVVAGGDGVVSVELVLSANPEVFFEGMPTDLVVVLDRSGSMNGSKIAEARRAVHALVDRLKDEDQFALVTYASDAWVDVPLSHPLPIYAMRTGDRDAWHRKIDEVEVGGGTNLSAGLDWALKILDQRQYPGPEGRVGRVLVISDGLANEGDATPEGLVGRARAASHKELAMSTIGVGDGFNERLLTSMADAGTGNFYYLAEGQLGDGGSDLTAMLTGELEAGRSTVAEAVQVAVTPLPGVRVLDAGGLPLETAAGTVSFRPGNLAAGQTRRVWVRLEVPHAEPGVADLGQIEMRWRQAGDSFSATLENLPQIACVADPDVAVAAIDDRVWERAVRDDGYGKLQQEIAMYVRDGRRAEAMETIERFRDEVSTLNAVVASEAVDATLDLAAELEAEVDDAFIGPDQVGKQNLLSKRELAAGWDSRRQGSKIEVAPSSDTDTNDTYTNDGQR